MCLLALSTDSEGLSVKDCFCTLQNLQKQKQVTLSVLLPKPFGVGINTPAACIKASHL